MHSPSIAYGAGSNYSNSPSGAGSSNKKHNYKPDGSGRDTYILDDNGGNYPMVERGAFLNTFKEKLRDGRQFEKETTYDYLLKRNDRMWPFMNRSQKVDLVAASMAGHN